MSGITTSDGTRLACRVDGPPHAPALLLINSLGCDASMWDDQVVDWARTHRVVRYDQRGHGSSEVGETPYTVERLGRDALEVLDALDVDAADVCGISLGGLVALWVARHAPERVRRLVVADSAARVGSEEAWSERAATVRDQGMDAVVEMVLARFFSPSFRERDPDTVETVRAALHRTPPEGYAASCDALAVGDLRAELAQVRAPALVIVGEEDEATPPADSHALVAGLPDAELLELPGAGHLANLERPGRFAAIVADFLDIPSDRSQHA